MREGNRTPYANLPGPANVTLSHPVELRVWAATCLTLTYCGTIGKILHILVMIKIRWSISGFHALLLALALVELINSSLVIPLLVLNAALGNAYMVNNYAICQLSGYSSVVVFYMITLLCAMIALNRLFAVCFSTKKFLTSKATAYFMICYAVLYPGTLSALPLFGIGGRFAARPPYNICIWDRSGATWAIWASSVGSVYVPFSFIVLSYLTIFVHVRFLRGRVWSTASSNARRQIVKQVQAAKIMFFATAAFAICFFIPVIVSATLQSFEKSFRSHMAVQWIYLLNYVGCSSNAVSSSHPIAVTWVLQISLPFRWFTHCARRISVRGTLNYVPVAPHFSVQAKYRNHRRSAPRKIR